MKIKVGDYFLEEVFVLFENEHYLEIKTDFANRILIKTKDIESLIPFLRNIATDYNLSLLKKLK
jgi:Holliday junction resolvase